MAMTFKELMSQDIEKVFVNTSEHGEKVNINGVDVDIVWDNETLNYRIQNDYQGLVVGDALFFISAKEWAKIPRVSNPPKTNEAILIAGCKATITLVSSNSGLYDITITYAGMGRVYG